MAASGLHPSLIFFEKDMAEDKRQKVIAFLQNDRKRKMTKHSDQLIKMEINNCLAGTPPQINLMFHDKGHGLKYDKYPGFLSIPYNTKLANLRDYVLEKTPMARKLAQEYIEE